MLCDGIVRIRLCATPLSISPIKMQEMFGAMRLSRKICSKTHVYPSRIDSLALEYIRILGGYDDPACRTGKHVAKTPTVKHSGIQKEAEN